MLIQITGLDKDQDQIVTLSISDLEAFTKVSTDNFYSQKSVWKNLSIEYASPINNQKKNIPISYNGETGSISTTIKYSEFFEGSSAKFSRIVIYDKGNGFLPIERSDLAVQDAFDIEFN